MKGLSLLVVGGGAGLGACFAEAAAGEGARAVAVVDRDADAADAAAASAFDEVTRSIGRVEHPAHHLGSTVKGQACIPMDVHSVLPQKR